MSRVLSAWVVLIGAFVVLTSVYGGFHFYSPVPFWDQWDGQVGFYQRFLSDPLHALWSQHNEHRIVFSRVLFLIDWLAFDAGNAFLVVVNYLLAAGTAAAFSLEYMRNGDKRLPRVAIIALIVGMLMLWTQENNLDWGFQSGSLGVNFFAVWAFALFARGGTAAPLMLVTAAMLTMGNGIAGFGALALMTILQRSGWKRLLIVVLAGAAAFVAYFYGYTKTASVHDPAAAHVALALPKFVVIFLGSPIFYVIHNLVAPAALGIVSLLCVSAAALYVIGTSKVTPYRAFLIGTYAFIAVSAVGVAHGRLTQGLDSAISSRYTSPALVGLVAGMLLVFDVVRFRAARELAVLGVALLTLLSTYQAAAFGPNDGLYVRKLAVLGQKTNHDRPDYDATVYPAYMHDKYVNAADFGTSHNIGVYGSAWMHAAGQRVDMSDLTTGCRGNLEATSAASGKMTVSGWTSDGSMIDKAVAIVDGTGETVGWGVTGLRRPDVRAIIPGAPRDAGWMAIADVKNGPLSAYVFSNGKWCRFFPASQ